MSRSEIITPAELIPTEVPRPHRFRTREVRIGRLTVGGDHPILIQSMTIADTCDTEAVVREIRRLVEVGCPLVRVTAPSIKDAENLREIRKRLDAAGIDVALVADIHFTPNAALVAAEIVDKVRINPGNYADRKKFQVFEISDQEYRAELERIRERFVPLVNKLKQHGTALRIGTNHGSLSDRIMNRYGDTPEGMVESALEFVRICRDEDFHEIVLSMKSSIPSVMIAAYRLLAHRMMEEGMDYPLHVGVTEAGNGLEGRIKSAIGIGSLLASGLGDTIRVSLTEDSEHEIPACRVILQAIRSEIDDTLLTTPHQDGVSALSCTASVSRRPSATWSVRSFEIGNKHPVCVELRLQVDARVGLDPLSRSRLARAGRPRGPELISVSFAGASPETSTQGLLTTRLREVRAASVSSPLFLEWPDPTTPIAELAVFLESVDGLSIPIPMTNQGLDRPRARAIARLCSESSRRLRWRFKTSVPPSIAAEVSDEVRRDGGASCGFVCEPGPLQIARIRALASSLQQRDDLIFLEAPSEGPSGPIVGAVLCDGIGDSICLVEEQSGDRTPWPPGGVEWTEEPVSSAYQILQACRIRLTRAEFIACPSCGRTQFDLQTTTARIRERTGHLRGVKIAIMGCIVNGPGEMADADFGYVGSGPGKIDLYVGKERVERSVPESEAAEKLIQLLRAHDVWVDPGSSDEAESV